MPGIKPFEFTRQALAQGSNQAVITKDFWGIENIPWTRPDVLEKTLPVFRELGIGILGRNCLDWATIEPNPPRNSKHFYHWQALDREFELYHQHGFRIQAVVRCRSSWATEITERELTGPAGSPPKEAYWRDWGKLIFELVERYDGDGFKDAFKMDYPILKIVSLQGEIEFPSHWKKYGGTPENYTRLLVSAYEEAKKAWPGVMIARAGTSVGDMFDSEPDSTLIARLMDRTPRSRNVFDFLRYSLGHPDGFDLFGIHANRSYRGIAPFVAWIRQHMKNRGYSKPIFIEDASSIMGGRAGIHERVSSDSAAQERQLSYEIHKVLDQGKQHPRYGWARTELYRLQAETVVKKCTVALASNVKGLMLTGYVDNPKSTFYQLRRGGLIDSDIYLETGDIRRSLKPSYYALRLFIEKVQGAKEAVEKLQYESDVYAFRFMRANRPFYILWCEGGDRSIELPTMADKVRITPINTSYGQLVPRQEVMATNNGKVLMRLNATPTFVEETR